MKPLPSHEPSTATPPSLGRELKQKIADRLAQISASGYWLCQDCRAVNSREEDDHGQPAYCGSCKSHRLDFYPGDSHTIHLRAVLEPEDLYD